MFITVYLIITTATALLYDGWEEHSSPLLPRQLAHHAIGHDASNHIIWLLGERTDRTPQQLVAYDYINDKITDHGATALPRFVYGETQFYAQIGSIIYIGDYYESYINTFNMETITFESNYALPPLNFVSTYSCVVSIRDDYLSLLGNDGNVQILDIHSQQWLQSVPSLIIGRSRSSCAYIHDKVFNIGGFNNNNGGRQSSIEYLDVSITSMVDIGSIYWQYNTDSLPYPIQNCRSIVVNNDVLVIGGYNGEYLNTIYTIDGVTGLVSLSGHLSKTVIDFALIVADNILYSFGGKDMDNAEYGWRQWQTKSITSITTTTSTTTSTTTAPTTSEPTTAEPTTKEPTPTTTMVQTTDAPTITIEPSTTPSKTPSDAVILVPSDSPSEYNSTNNVSYSAPTIETLIQTKASMVEASSTSYTTDSVWNGTVINITLSIDGNISLTDVMYTVHTTIINILIASDIASPLESHVIVLKTPSTIVINFEISQQLEGDELNIKEMAEETQDALNDRYEGKVKVDDITSNMRSDYIKKDNAVNGYKNRDLWLILGLSCLSVCIILFLVGVIIGWKKKRMYKESSKHITINSKTKSCDVDAQGSERKQSEGVVDIQQHVVDTRKGSHKLTLSEGAEENEERIVSDAVKEESSTMESQQMEGVVNVNNKTNENGENVEMISYGSTPKVSKGATKSHSHVYTHGDI